MHCMELNGTVGCGVVVVSGRNVSYTKAVNELSNLMREETAHRSHGGQRKKREKAASFNNRDKKEKAALQAASIP